MRGDLAGAVVALRPPARLARGGRPPPTLAHASPPPPPSPRAPASSSMRPVLLSIAAASAVALRTRAGKVHAARALCAAEERRAAAQRP